MLGRKLPENWVGLTVGVVLMTGSALIVSMNLGPDPSQPPGSEAPLLARRRDPQAIPLPGEGLIGEEVGRNRLTIRAGYRPAPRVDDQEPAPGSTRLEVDVYAEADNPQAIPQGGFVPYLRVGYRIEPVQGGPAVEEGILKPTVAQGGMHYGATIKPAAGSYMLILNVGPPGDAVARASDEATGVAAWWEPFTVAFAWDYPGMGDPNPSNP